MGKSVGHHIALAPPLQSIIADRRCRLNRRLDIAGLNEPPFLFGMMSPYSRKAVSLQLNADLQLIGIGLIHALLRLLHARQDAEQVLHMVTYLVGNHIGLGELARLAPHVAAAEAAFEVVKERRVEIYVAI